FSLTLHGSDLLLNGSYLDAKLEHSTACFTISEFNRRHILNQYPNIDPRKVIVQRLGVETIPPSRTATPDHQTSELRLLSVGRLHPVKNHAFLIRACSQLKQRHISFHCRIAGEGPERNRLKNLIATLNLTQEV